MRAGSAFAARPVKIQGEGMRHHIATVFLLLGALLSTSCQGRSSSERPEHAVIVHFDYGATDLQPLFALENRLERALASAKAGEFDGNEVATDGSDGYLYMYGPDADRLFAAVLPVLESSDFMEGAVVTKRYGPPEDGVRETVVRIDP